MTLALTLVSIVLNMLWSSTILAAKNSGIPLYLYLIHSCCKRDVEKVSFEGFTMAERQNLEAQSNSISQTLGLIWIPNLRRILPHMLQEKLQSKNKCCKFSSFWEHKAQDTSTSIPHLRSLSFVANFPKQSNQQIKAHFGIFLWNQMRLAQGAGPPLKPPT